MHVLAIDPGYEQSAWLRYNGARVLDHAIEPNTDLLLRFTRNEFDVHAVVFESIESYGMAVGREVFETVFWTGRLFQEASRAYRSLGVHRMPRRDVKQHLCYSARATDSNIRVALVDRFGGTASAVGKKASPGPLYGIKSHEWAALAIAVTWMDKQAVRSDQAALSAAGALR